MRQVVGMHSQSVATTSAIKHKEDEDNGTTNDKR